MRISSITKNAGKACNNRLYRHIRTFEKIVKNYFVIYVDTITYITMSFLMVLVLIRPSLIMAEDYIDYLDCGDTPPAGSQYWVAPFVAEFIGRHKGILDEKLDEYLRKITGMQL